MAAAALSVKSGAAAINSMNKSCNFCLSASIDVNYITKNPQNQAQLSAKTLIRQREKTANADYDTFFTNFFAEKKIFTFYISFNRSGIRSHLSLFLL